MSLTSYLAALFRSYLGFFVPYFERACFLDFKPKKSSYKITKISNLEKITNIFFSNKRKMINKSIKKILNKNQINNIHNLSLDFRPADIKPDVYYKITELYEKN